MIGDPSGRTDLRPVLTPEQVLANAQTYRDQIGRIIDVNKVQVRFNSEWFGPMRLADFLAITTKLTVPRLLERDDFAERLKKGHSLTVSESLYPVLQGFDSVALKADVELGGTDQKFNLLLGRALQERYGQEPQVVLTVPLLEGTDGVQKMSKSLGNAIGITEPPSQIYGKLMSIPDDRMIRYYELLTDEDLNAVKKMHPMEAKQKLASLLTAQFHGDAAAETAQENFNQVFRKRENPDEMQEFKVPASLVKNGRVPIVELLVQSGLAPSKSHAKRLVLQGGVDFAGQRVTDAEALLQMEAGAVLKAGKRRFVKLTL